MFGAFSTYKEKLEYWYPVWKCLLFTLSCLHVAEHFPTDGLDSCRLCRSSTKSLVGNFCFQGYHSTIKYFFISETVFVYIHRWWIWEKFWFGPRDICLHNKCNKSFGGTCHKQVQMKLVFSVCEVTFLWLTLLPRKLTSGFYHVVFVDHWCIQLL